MERKHKLISLKEYAKYLDIDYRTALRRFKDKSLKVSEYVTEDRGDSVRHFVSDERIETKVIQVLEGVKVTIDNAIEKLSINLTNSKK